MSDTHHESELGTLGLKQLFWKYSIPTIGAMLVSAVYTTTDGLFIGRFIGAEGLAAINLLWTVYGLIVGLGVMIGIATCALFSIEKGKKNEDKARKYLANGFILLILLSFLSMLFIGYFAYPIMRFQLPDSPIILDLAMDYLNILKPFFFVSLFGVAAPMFLRNDEHPMLATKLLILGAIINTIADYILICKLGLSMRGAGIATVLAQGSISIISLLHFFSKRANLRLYFSDFKISFPLWKKIISLGLSSFAMSINFSVIAVSYNFFFVKFGSPVTLAAYSIVGYVGFVYYILSEGICSAIQPIVSYNHGAQRQYNILRILRMAIKTLFILYLFMLIVVFSFTHQIAQAFSKDDMILEQETVLGLRLHLIGAFLEGLVLLGVSYFQAIDKSKLASMFAIINLFIQIPFLFLLSKLWGVIGVWLTNPVENIPLSILSIFLMRKMLRKNVWHRFKEEKRKKSSSEEI